MENLEAQGYTVLHAREDWGEYAHEFPSSLMCLSVSSLESDLANASAYVYHLYRQFPDLVKVIIGDKEGEKGEATHYYKSEGRPDGIPAWKVGGAHAVRS